MSGRQSNVGCEARALVAQGILDDLHHNTVAFADHVLDVRRLVAVLGDGWRCYVRGVQERGSLETNIDKRSLHPG